MVGLGEIPLAILLRGLLEAKGIGLNEAFHSGDLTTIVKTRVMVRNQQLCRLDREDSPSRYAFGPDEIKRVVDCATGADAVILSDYGKGSLSTELISALNNSEYYLRWTQNHGGPSVIEA